MFNHEETAHAIRILNQTSAGEEQEHIDYQGKLPNKMDNSLSPDISQLKRKTKAGKNVAELKIIINAKNKKINRHPS